MRKIRPALGALGLLLAIGSLQCSKDSLGNFAACNDAREASSDLDLAMSNYPGNPGAAQVALQSMLDQLDAAAGNADDGTLASLIAQTRQAGSAAKTAIANSQTPDFTAATTLFTQIENRCSVLNSSSYLIAP